MVERSKKEQYVTAIIGTIIGIICIVISLKVGLDSGWITLIFGILFGGGGIVSFFSPIVSEVLGQIMKNISHNAERQEVRQHQHKSHSSPQAQTIHGGVTYNYGSPKESKEHTGKGYNKIKIKKRLEEIKIELKEAMRLSFREGGFTQSALKKEIKGIIHKVYLNNPEENVKRLVTSPFAIYTTGSGDDEFQRDYLKDLQGLVKTIDIILRELDYDDG